MKYTREPFVAPVFIGWRKTQTRRRRQPSRPNELVLLSQRRSGLPRKQELLKHMEDKVKVTGNLQGQILAMQSIARVEKNR